MARRRIGQEHLRLGNHAEALDDRTSFHRFCGFASDESTPERKQAHKETEVCLFNCDAVVRKTPKSQ
jgi:hypothetical protein